jgi:prepilin-type N-terminal cleavage/methylation domain-containing protein
MKNEKGYTLIELMVAMAIFAIVIVLSSNMLFFTMKVPAQALNEYDIQSNMRVLTQKLTVVIRDSSAVFALHRVNHNNLTAGWNYIIPSDDQTRIIEYKWDDSSSTHIKTEVSHPIKQLKF